MRSGGRRKKKIGVDPKAEQTENGYVDEPTPNAFQAHSLPIS